MRRTKTGMQPKDGVELLDEIPAQRKDAFVGCERHSGPFVALIQGNAGQNFPTAGDSFK
jgi:hypothetical protein